MKFLERERKVLEAYTPGLDAQLAAQSLEDLEARDGKAVALLREAGGVKLMIPRPLGGFGASALAAVQYQRAVGSRAPSLAIASTMHHYKIAALARALAGRPNESFLAEIGREGWLIASCGSEGRPGREFFIPNTIARAVDGGLMVSGVKRPCCLTWSMGLLSMMLTSPPDSPYEGQLVNVIVPAESRGIRRNRFWGSRILAAAESDEVVLDEVFVPHERVFAVGEPQRGTDFSYAAFIWFEMLASASYLGMASGMVERALARPHGREETKVQAALEVEAAMAALERIAEMATDSIDADTLARTLLVRYAVQGAISRATATAMDLLGGGAFCGSEEGPYLLAASRALAFHPPGLDKMGENLGTYLTGGPLDLA